MRRRRRGAAGLAHAGGVGASSVSDRVAVSAVHTDLEPRDVRSAWTRNWSAWALARR